MITEQLADLVEAALDGLRRDGLLPTGSHVAVNLERPRNPDHGDWSTNAAMLAAQGTGNPRELAAALVARIPQSDLVDKVEVAGPGFINFRLSTQWLVEVIRRASDPGGSFGRSLEGSGKRINIEYVSANPTGPINVVSGRHAAVGDVIANLLEATGYSVTREFYVNDGGRQVDLFARSLAARYQQERGVDASIPEDGYVGDYVAELANAIAADTDVPVGDESALVAHMRTEGVARMVASMKASLETFGSRFDVWFSERTLHPDGVETAIRVLREKGLTEQKEGAVWFRASELGDDKDRVLVRSNGDPTYLAPDLAYFADKFARGFDALIYLLGSDHHGTVARMLAGAEAMGFERGRVEVLLVQIVNLRRAGTLLKGSKRQGVIVPLEELVDEVGVDAARYTFLTRSLDSPLDFDIDLVKEQAPENPVYYVQYAHARICSILRKATADGLDPSPSAAPLHLIHHSSELDLARKIAEYEEVVPDAARRRAPHRITRYIEELASTFSAFYRDCKVMTDDAELTSARLALCVATRKVVGDGLGLLGVSAPERM